MTIRTSLAHLSASLAPQEVPPPFVFSELSADGTIATGVQGDHRADALFEAGSIGKFACTIAALRLQDRGALHIDETLGELLPEVADTPIADVTLRQVLASRSGFADGLLPAFGADPQAVMATPDALTATLRYASGALAAEPGSTWSYDLVNWIVVQAVLEARSGEPVADVLTRVVLQPAGMGSSRIFVGSDRRRCPATRLIGHADPRLSDLRRRAGDNTA